MVDRTAVVTEVADRVLARGAHRLRVGVDGLTAAGKTTFGDELARAVEARGRPALRAGLDDFKKPWRDRHLYDRLSGRGYYRNAYDYDAVSRLLLRPAGPDGSGVCVLRSIDPATQVDHSAEVTVATPDAVLIVDGVFAFRPQLDHFWDFRIWLHVDEDTSVRRGVARDGTAYSDRYPASERLYLAEVDPVRRVDLIIDNTAFDRPVIRPRPGAG